jgi:hypothetical protein
VKIKQGLSLLEKAFEKAGALAIQTDHTKAELEELIAAIRCMLAFSRAAKDRIAESMLSQELGMYETTLRTMR